MTRSAASYVRFILYRLLPVVILLVASVIILVSVYITTPHAAAKISTILSDRLGLPVTIASIHLHGDTLTFQGIIVGNPAGFAGQNLVSVTAVRVAPAWTGLLQGQRNLRLLDIAGAQVDLRKDSDGVWNFENIRKKLSAGSGGAELFIGDLRLSNGDILINGKGIRGISLKLRNVASKGSAASTANLDFDDLSGNRYSVTGSFRAGAVPEAELSLKAESLALAGMTGENKPVAVTAGTGTLQINAKLHEGAVRAVVAATISGGRVTLRDGAVLPLSGNLHGSATYDLKQEVAKLDQSTLILDDLLEMSAKGDLTGLKSGLRCDLALAIQRLDLAKLAALLPALRKNRMRVEGTISADKIRIVRDLNQGDTSITGVVSLRDMLIARNGELLLNGIGTDMKIATAGNSIRFAGELTQKPAVGKPLLESTRAPYSVFLTNKMKPQSVNISGFSARVLGAPLGGNFTLRPADNTPLALSLKMPRNKLKALAYADLSVDGGAAALSLDLKGTSSTNFSGSAALSLDDLNGSSKGDRFALGQATVNADFSSAGGRYTASGTTAFDRVAFKGVAADGRFGFTATEGTLQLENGTVKVADATLSFARSMATLPGKTALAATKGYPLDVRISGGAASRGEIKLSGIAASLRGNYGGSAGAKRFAGDGKIAAEKLFWRGKEIGAPAADIAVSPAEANITLTGTVLGGTVAGALTGNPYSLAEGVNFDFSLKGAELTHLSKMIWEKGAPAFSNGQLLVTGKGSYSRKNGVAFRLQGKGNNIAIATSGSKELLNNGSVTFDASLAEGNITLNDALVQLGEGAAVRLKGAVAKALSPQRDGVLTYNLDRAPLERLIDPLANSLPRLLQEAAVSGDIAAEGSLALHKGRITLQGFVQLDGAGLDAGPKKLQVADISGRIPFILGFPAQRTASPEQTTVLKRPKYAEQLALFSKEALTGSLLKIGRIGFGPLEFSNTALRITAAEGIIEALSFTSSLTTGKILGRGYVAFSKGASYGGDLLINNLSLEQLCALFPNIKGYVSGRVDGIAMFEGSGGKINELNGYTWFWTRAGNGEKMLVSKEFLQKLAGKKLQGFLFRTDRAFDKGEVMASLQSGYLTFDILDIENTNFFGVRDLKVTVTETQNRIALEHLLDSVSQAVSRGKGAAGKGSADKKSTDEAAPPPAFKWDE